MMFLEDDEIFYKKLGINFKVGETLNEFATILIDEKENISLAVNPDNNRNLQGKQYFKFYNHQDYKRATKIARIRFDEPEYIIHGNFDGKENWNLNSKERKVLIKELKKYSFTLESYRLNYFQFLICQYNLQAYGVSYLDTVNKKNKKGLPIDLEMPDYMKL
jgi:hypothetical protein